MASNEFVLTLESGMVKSVNTVQPNETYRCLDKFLGTFSEAISNMRLKHKDEDTIYSLVKELISNVSNLLIDGVDKLADLKCNKVTASEIILRNMELVGHKLQQNDTRFKRQKVVCSNDNYVAPQEKAIGLKWCSKLNPGSELPSHKILQTTFHYIPILDTLKKIFADDHFADHYFKNNENRVCRSDAYEDFCCGSIFKNSTLFNDNPDAIQIQLAVDDFEVCCGLKSKATVNKICGVYFQVRNVPAKLRSKLNHIYLVALCNSNELKRSGGFNTISELIVKEIGTLETIGLEINPNKRLKGTIINISADNLGANGLFGFAESFNSSYYCRQCEVPKEECQQILEESESNHRGKVFWSTRDRKQRSQKNARIQKIMLLQ